MRRKRSGDSAPGPVIGLGRRLAAVGAHPLEGRLACAPVEAVACRQLVLAVLLRPGKRGRLNSLRAFFAGWAVQRGSSAAVPAAERSPRGLNGPGVSEPSVVDTVNARRGGRRRGERGCTLRTLRTLPIFPALLVLVRKSEEPILSESANESADDDEEVEDAESRRRCRADILSRESMMMVVQVAEGVDELRL